jgi:hypothetical protein
MKDKKEVEELIDCLLQRLIEDRVVEYHFDEPELTGISEYRGAIKTIKWVLEK